MSNFELEQAIWTDADFERMGWHDCHIHAIGLDSEHWSVLFDLDYIFRWVDPAPPDQHYNFWIAPVTMNFVNAHSLSTTLDVAGLQLEIADLRRGEQRATKNGAMTECLYHLECQEGVLKLWATGFQMVVRRRPVLKRAPCFNLEERGGISMSLEPADL